jgi:hypothetical protein
LGVALSAVFLLWFASGIVMMYWGFPEVTELDRLARAPVLVAARVTLSPAEAAASIQLDQPPGQVQLASFDGRPVYLLDGGAAVVYADDGTLPGEVDDAMIDRAAAAWAGKPVHEATKTSMVDVDQWTVGGLRSVRPLYKYSWPDGQQVYVNGSTSEVVQYTTTSSRFWAYLGAIPHWLYFTPLRKHPQEWFSVVVWASLIGTAAALMGVVIAIWMYSPRKRYRYAGAPTSVPYRGWKRWHMIVGLCFGVVATTWTFSGLLSMGPFPIMDRLTELTVPSDASGAEGRELGGRGGDGIADALRGRDTVELVSYADKHPGTAIASVPDFEVKELEYVSFAGEPAYLARNGSGGTRIVPVHGEPLDSFPPGDVMRIVRDVAGAGLAEIRLMDEYDAYYLDRRGERPLPVIYARMNDAAGTRVYVDPKTARVVGSYSARNWVNRWLYHGLHSLDFPWLYRYRPLWDIVVITLMLGGTALCVTSIVMTWRVLARKLAVLVRARFSPVNEDLALDAER